MTVSDNLVSIIIPCYNQVRFVGAAIESAQQQSYRDFEIIVVDDGSTDKTLDVVSSHPKVQAIRQENQGVSVARNNGARASKGRYLVFLDGDDRLLPNALETGVKEMQRHPKCAMVFGRYRTIGADGSSMTTVEYPVVEKDHYLHLLVSNFIHTPSIVMCRRSVFENLQGFDPRLTHAEDYDLYLRISRRFSILGYDEIVAEYRRHDANMSDNYALMSKVCLSILQRQRRHVRGNREWEKARQLGIRTYRRQWGELFFSNVLVHLRAPKQIKSSAQDVILLMRYSLDVFPRRLGRKISRSLSGVWC